MTSLFALAITVFTALTPVKVHVDGDGYLRFVQDGRVVYTKAATLATVDGCLGAAGAKLLPTIAVPEGAASISVDLMGNVTSGNARLGRLVLGLFPASATGSPAGSFLSFSDRASLAGPGDETAGVIRIDGASQVTKLQESPAKPASEVIKGLGIAISGAGYFAVASPTGQTWYTRDSTLTMNALGQLITQQGFLVEPNIFVPPGSTHLLVGATGGVSAILPGLTEPVLVGNIMLTTFASPGDLARLDSSLFEQSPRSGDAQINAPGQGGAGLILFNGVLHGDASTAAVSRTVAQPSVSTRPVPKTTTHPKGANGPQVEILVHQHTDVPTMNFALGDIADVTGPSDLVDSFKHVVIGATAVAGTNRIVDQRYVVLKLMGAGHRVGSYVLVVPDGADVARKVRTVDSDDIIAAAVKAAQDKIGVKIAFKSNGNVRPIVGEDADITLETSVPEQSGKNFIVTVTARQGSNIVGARTVTLSPSGDVASIKAGDPVTVLLKSGTAQIEVQGKALSQGFIGQHVQVSVTGVGSKTTTHTGTVIDTGKVEVDL